jgi:hypothetical protein
MGGTPMNSLKMRFVFSVMVVVFSGLDGWAADPNVNLQFGSDGKFKIAQFTDMHWEVWQPDSTNQASLDYMARVLDFEQPDMVVLTGDIIPTVYANISLWERTVKVLQDRHIPWAVTLGNHDRENPLLPAQQLMAALAPMPYSLVANAQNYVLNVKDSSGEENALGIYCMDSQKNGMTPTNVQWYRTQSAAMTAANGGTPLPSLAFFHIPLPEFTYFGTSYVNGQIGQKRESVCYETPTADLFGAIEASGDVMGVFVGHDHWNDYALFFDDVCLAYGRKTGENGYGTYARGGRIIELTEGQPGFDSWIRTQEGAVVDSFHFQPVPEPSSMLMLLSGLAGLVLLARRRAA